VLCDVKGIVALFLRETRPEQKLSLQPQATKLRSHLKLQKILGE